MHIWSPAPPLPSQGNECQVGKSRFTVVNFFYYDLLIIVLFSIRATITYSCPPLYALIFFLRTSVLTRERELLTGWELISPVEIPWGEPPLGQKAGGLPPMVTAAGHMRRSLALEVGGI